MLCRLCLYDHNKDNVLALYIDNEESNLTKLIAKYLHIEVTKNDSYSTMICEKCVDHLSTFHEYCELIEHRQSLLQKEFLECKYNENIGSHLISEEINETTIHMLENKKDSLFHNKEKYIKTQLVKNPIEKTSFQTESRFAENETHRIKLIGSNEIDDDEIPVLDLLIKIENRNSANSKLRNTRNMKILGNKKKNKAKHSNKSQLVSETKKLTTKPKSANNSRIIYKDLEKDDLISKYISLKCDMCDSFFDTYRNLQIHFRENHERKAYIKCCGRKYTKRSLLFDHIQLHLNPNYFKCDICDKILKNRASLDLHKDLLHVDRSLLKHVCTFCNMRFRHLSNLNSHLFKHKKERNIICTHCNKGYKSENMLKIHMQHMHEKRNIFVCETCGKEYKLRVSLEHHVAAEHQDDYKEIKKQCTICNAWVKPNYLSRHIKRHNPENVDCEICGQTFISRRSLTGHIESTHKEKKVLPCNICNKIFNKPRYLKEHMDMHLGRKDYNCTYCSREFRSKSNMYAHVKKVHFEQWNQIQQQRLNGASYFDTNNINTNMDLKNS